ncbi:hypothetical protein ACLB9Y_04900 [Chryseobacterium scophthalmum]|uniref:hypothetical protein n=1 Tax=Chryseobacterium scophthalmum TaxID=59733 RepID=UPI00398A7E7E
MKKIFVKQIQIILLQSIEASFKADLYQSYKEEFKESRDFFSINQPNYEMFLKDLRESLKVILNNTSKIELLKFFPQEDLAPAISNEELIPYFILLWSSFFSDENWIDEYYQEVSFEMDDKEF